MGERDYSSQGLMGERDHKIREERDWGAGVDEGRDQGRRESIWSGGCCVAKGACPMGVKSERFWWQSASRGSDRNRTRPGEPLTRGVVSRGDKSSKQSLSLSGS